MAHRVDTVAFDKTGTLTGPAAPAGAGDGAGVDEAAALRSAASLQSGSEHPLARAVTEAAEARELAWDAPQDAQCRAAAPSGRWLGTKC